LDVLATFAAVLLGLVTAGAASSVIGAAAPATPAAAEGLPAVVWQLTAITLSGASATVPDDPAKYSLQFLPDGMVLFRADCNQGSGRYAVDGTSLAITELVSTLVGCPPGSLEAEYTGALQRVTAYGYDEASLVLTLREDAGSLRFRPTLAGVVWEWEVFEGGDGSEIRPDDPATYTLEFLPDGTVTIRADCNRGSGTYAVDGDHIEITVGGMTEVECPPGSLFDRYVRYLDEGVSHVFREGKLYLALPMDAGILEYAARPVEDAQATPSAG